MISNPYSATAVLLLTAAGSFGQTLPLTARVRAAVSDAAGSIYLAGDITTADLPATHGSFQPDPPKKCPPTSSASDCRHGFVAKVAPSGDSLSWATYFAGDQSDSVIALAIAADGDILLAGNTTSKTSLPALNGFQATPGPMFIAKLTRDGRSLTAGTYFGGDAGGMAPARDTLTAIKLDGSGHVYIAGNAVSAAFPTTAGVVQRARSTDSPPSGYGAHCSEPSDQFLAKFDASLKNLLFSTLLGTSARETANDVAIGADGMLYVAGTRGPELGLPGICPTRHILTKLSPDAASLIYTAEKSATPGRSSVAVDRDGFAYFAGDDSGRTLNTPSGRVWKLDQRGATIAEASINGWIQSLAVGPPGQVVALGRTAGLSALLSPTHGAPRMCTPPADPSFWSFYVARWNASTMSLVFSAHLHSPEAWLTGSERAVAKAPYVNFPEYAVVPAGRPPDGTVACVANAAIYAGSAVSPGEVLSIFGFGIGPDRPAIGQLDEAGNFTSSLSGIRVSIGGIFAPLLYAGPDQINLVAPFGIPGTGRVRVEIHRGGSLIRSFDQDLLPLRPGIFTMNSTGTGALAALNQDWSLNTATNMASPGDIVSIFTTGLGAMSPQPVDGSTPLRPVSKPIAPVAVFVGDLPQQQAEVHYAGNAPGLVQGVVQINFRLPETLDRSPHSNPNLVNVRIVAGDPNSPNSSSQFGTIFVR